MKCLYRVKGDLQKANGVNIIMEGRFMHGESYFNNKNRLLSSC